MINGNQVRAARGLLNWTVNELSEKTGLQPGTITAFENATRPATADTIERITAGLQQGGIEFTATGVQIASPIYSFDGPSGYIDLLRDVLASGAKDVIIQNADNRKSSPEVLQLYRSLWEAGAKFRITSEEGNSYLVLPVSCYRWLPKDYFRNHVTVIYGDRVAFSVNNDHGCKVIRDAGLAESLRYQFKFVWDLLKPLIIESTADERIT